MMWQWLAQWFKLCPHPQSSGVIPMRKYKGQSVKHDSRSKRRGFVIETTQNVSQTWSTLIVDALSHAYPVPYTETVSSPARILPSPGKDFYDLRPRKKLHSFNVKRDYILQIIANMYFVLMTYTDM